MQEVKQVKVVWIYLLSLVLLAWSVAGYGVIDETMVLCLSFDDGAGNIATDSSKNRLNGKVEGAVWVDGKFGKALEFDGVDDFVEVPDDPELLLLDGGTFMAWVYIKEEKGHASWPRILIKSNTNGGTHGYDFLFDRAAGYSIRFCIGGACNSYFPMETESWHHVAATFDGKTIKIYADGKKVGEGPQPGPAIDTKGSPLRIGNGVAIDRPYHGMFDEIRIWSRPLKDAEIAEQMGKGTKEMLAVDPILKIATTWAELKGHH